MRRADQKKVQAAVNGAVEAAFTRGFGVALAELWRYEGNRSLVRNLAKANGYTLRSFSGVGLMKRDYDALRAALVWRAPSCSVPPRKGSAP